VPVADANADNRNDDAPATGRVAAPGHRHRPVYGIDSEPRSGPLPAQDTPAARSPRAWHEDGRPPPAVQRASPFF
jgi:hypothetical protein